MSHLGKMGERQITKDRVEQRILLSSSPVSTDQIEEALHPLHASTVGAAIRELAKSGRIKEVGAFGNRKMWTWVGRSNEEAKVKPPSINFMAGTYQPEPWTHVISRPSSTRHEEIPSRMGNKRIFRDGREEEIHDDDKA